MANRLRILIAALVFGGVMLCWPLLRPENIRAQPPPCVASIAFTPGTAQVAQVSVTISNRSGQALNYFGGLYTVAYSQDGVWHTNYVSSYRGGHGTLAPHSAIFDVVKLPRQASAAKVGFDFVVLTWRGKTAWRIARGPLRLLLGWITPYLMRFDEKSGSGTAWSNILRTLPREKDRIPKSMESSERAYDRGFVNASVPTGPMAASSPV